MTSYLARAAAAIGAVTLAAFGSAAHAEGEGLAFSPLSLDIPALKGLSEGVKAVGGDAGYDVIVLDPKFDATQQATQLNQLLATGRAKAAWVIAVNPGAMGSVIDTAQQAGAVLVVNGVPSEYGFDGMIPGVTFANIDYDAYGGGAGKLAAQCANEKLGGKGKALWVQFKEGTAGKEEIEAGITSALEANAPGIEIVQEIIATDRAEALTKTGQVLQAHPDIQIVISENDEGALGALGAFEAAGKDLPCDVAMGGNEEVLSLVEAGELYGAAALNFGADLMQTFEAIEMMLADPSANGRQQSVPLDIKAQN